MRRLLCVMVLSTAAYGASVGSGSPSPNAMAGFINAWYRGYFAVFTLPPTSDVAGFGPTGLIQLFPARPPLAANLTFALIKPDPNAPPSSTDTLQVFSDIYPVYNSIGVGNAGYPTMDTTPCPTSAGGTCNYQLFAKNYGIFVYSAPAVVTYTIKDPFYTEWANQGGVSGSLGVPISGMSAVTSPSKLTGSQQNYLNGAAFSYSTTTPTGAVVVNTYSTFGTTYSAYLAGGGLPVLGFPAGQEVAFSGGLHRQIFENARIEWSQTAPAQILFPVSEIDIQGSAQGLSLNLGDTATLNANTLDSNGATASGRAISWTTSNGQAISIQGNGSSATVKALAKGFARVTATAEGKTSAPIQIRVASPCCDVGEGAPTPAITLAFQNAVSRNRLSLMLPNPDPVTRAAGGYVQQFTSTTGAAIVICESDRSSTAYALSGSVYTSFLATGGYSGPLGYPASDVSAGGTQVFESGGALAGPGATIVPAPIEKKWVSLGSETGPAGLPMAAASAYQSSAGTSGLVQVFAGGSFYSNASGQAFFSTGLILARYAALSGPAGALGAPVSDIVLTSGISRQTFENGYIDLQPGATSAIEHVTPRKPAITASPTRVAPGSRVHLALSGFTPGASLVVSQTGRPDFRVAAATYSWDVTVPTGSTPGTVTVQVKDLGGTDVASTSYSIVSIPQLAPSFTVVSGDAQSGAPGSVVPLPLVAVLKDNSGNPIAGIPVFSSASTGASVQSAPVTDANGQVAATLRLPGAGGVVIASLTSGGKVVSFSARAAGSSITAFPVLSQQDTTTLVGGESKSLAQKGSLTTALAGLIRYHQNAGRLGAPNGMATPQALNQFLTTNGGYAASETGDLIANPWVAMEFAGVRGGIAVETPTLNRLYDLLGAGIPALIGISVQISGVPAGMTYAVATGVGDDGSVQIADPAMGRTNLNDYTNGFASGGGAVTGVTSVLLQMSPLQTTPNGFVVGAPVSAGASVSGPGGACSTPLSLTDIAVPTGANLVPAQVGGVRYVACDGTQVSYQVNFSSRLPAGAVDLASAAWQNISTRSALSFSVTRSASGLVFAPQSLAISGLVNSASYTPGISPGGLATFFGAGLSAETTDSTSPNSASKNAISVKIGGVEAYIYAATPFQINFQIPSGVNPGQVPAVVTGSLGQVTQTIAVLPVAPAVFQIGTAADGTPLGAAINQDGTLNSVMNPAARGNFVSLYGTGLGSKTMQGSYQMVQTPVTVLLGGTEIVPSYAGICPGLIGVDQINFQIPNAVAPSLGSKVALRQAGSMSPAVEIAIQ